jgi:hypothetical protein
MDSYDELRFKTNMVRNILKELEDNNINNEKIKNKIIITCRSDYIKSRENDIVKLFSPKNVNKLCVRWIKNLSNIQNYKHYFT